MVKTVGRETMTIAQAIDVYRGSKTAKVFENNWNDLVSYGKGSALGKTDIERIFHYMIVENILEEDYVSNRMGFTSAYLKVLITDLDRTEASPI